MKAIPFLLPSSLLKISISGADIVKYSRPLLTNLYSVVNQIK